MRTPFALVLLVLVSPVVNVAAAQISIAAELGERAYIVWKQRAHFEGLANEIYLASDAQSCAGAFEYGGDYFIVRRFDRWAQPVYEPVSVDPGSSRAQPICVAQNSPLTWVSWTDNVGHVYHRGFLENGDPLGPRLPIQADSYEDPRASDLTDERGAIGLTSANGSNVDTHVRIYSPDGVQELSGRISLAHPFARETEPSLAIMPDGAVLVAYLRSVSGSSTWYYPTLTRIEPDFTVRPYVTLAFDQTDRIYIRAQVDGSALIVCRLRDGAGAFARRFDALGQPLGDPMPVDPEWVHAGATSDGRVALLGRQGEPREWWVRLYDSGFQPLTGRVMPLVGAPPSLSYVISNQGRELTYADDGTIWLAWVSDGGFGPTWLTTLKPYLPGDMNFDSRIDNFDIDAFVWALTDPDEYEERYSIPPEVGRILGDVNEDGALNNFDIDPFVELLIAQP